MSGAGLRVDRITAVVVAPPLRGPDPDDELAALLGEHRRSSLTRLLLARAVACASSVIGRRVGVVAEPEDRVEVGALLGDDVTLVDVPAGDAADRLRQAAGAMSGVETAGDCGPLLVMWPSLPSWGSAPLAAALDDLSNGCAVSVAPIFDGGFYLIAMARPIPRLFELSDATLTGPSAMLLLLAAAHEEGLDVGLLRPERALRRTADVKAALADPLLDDELRALLRG